MKRTALAAAALFACVMHAGPVLATQQIGQACTTDQQHLPTVKSVISTEGVIECIPDSNGNLFWQAMGAGIARYDATSGCGTAGTLRWNGSSIQYCDGANWNGVGGNTVIEGGCLTYWAGCPDGYHVTSYFSPGTYNCCDRCGNPAWRYHRVLAMNRCVVRLKALVALCATGLLYSCGVPAYAQGPQQNRLPTIADCPAGYGLAVQDLNELTPLARNPALQAGVIDPQTAQTQESAFDAQQNAAPRRFITGCIPRARNQR